MSSWLKLVLLVILVVVIIVSLWWFVVRGRKTDKQKHRKKKKKCKNVRKPFNFQKHFIDTSSSSSSGSDSDKPEERWKRCKGQSGLVDLMNDSKNCGRCNKQCAPGLVCRDGKCVCPNATDRLCNGVCINVSNDAANCGKCGKTCKPHLACVNGKCRCADPNATNCGRYCANLHSDEKNCGECGRVCPDGYSCENGICTPCNGIICDGVCKDTKNDSSNCGSCGNVCPPGSVCVDGACACTDPSKLLCPDGCFDSQTDVKNCGSCGYACPGSHLACVGGNCQCPNPDTTNCGSYCANLSSDSSNCGACGYTCPGNHLVCRSGACQCQDVNATNCGTYCANLNTDASNCGTCGFQCPVGSTCISGTCVCTVVGQTPCPSGCTDTKVDNNNCGTCGTVCPLGKVCTNGSCVDLFDQPMLINYNGLIPNSINTNNLLSSGNLVTWSSNSTINQYVYDPSEPNPRIADYIATYAGLDNDPIDIPRFMRFKNAANSAVKHMQLQPDQTNPSSTTVRALAVNVDGKNQWTVRRIPNVTVAPVPQLSSYLSNTIYLSERPGSSTPSSPHICKLHKSTDQGVTWTEYLVRSVPGASTRRGTTFFVNDSSSTPIIMHTYPSTPTLSETQLLQQTSTDEGKNWAPPVTLFDHATTSAIFGIPTASINSNGSIPLFVASTTGTAQSHLLYIGSLRTDGVNRSSCLMRISNNMRMTWSAPLLVNIHTLINSSGWLGANLIQTVFNLTGTSTSNSFNQVAISDDAKVICFRYTVTSASSPAIPLAPNTVYPGVVLSINGGTTWLIFNLIVGGGMDGLPTPNQELINSIYINKNKEVFVGTQANPAASPTPQPFYRVYKYNSSINRFTLIANVTSAAIVTTPNGLSSTRLALV